MKTLEEIKENCKLHHTALCRGYVSRKSNAEPVIEEYSGRFGRGYKVYSPNWRSTEYCYVSYYIDDTL